MQKILVWDWPTRVFHWLFAASFLIAYITSDSEKWRVVHLTCGYVFLTMLVFRLVWGLVGSRYVRFCAFVRGPSAIAHHIKTELLQKNTTTSHAMGHNQMGHNPLGAVAIVLMLFFGLIVGLTGALNDWAQLGFSWLHFWSEPWQNRAAHLHEGAANFMLLIVIGHWAGVAWGRWHYGKTFITAMFTGLREGQPADAIPRSYPVIGLLLVALAAYVVWLSW